MTDATPTPRDASRASLARKVLRGAAYLGIAQYATLGIGLIKTPILARLIRPEIHGAVALAVSWVSFLNIFRMELREIVISDPEGHPARLTTQYVIEVITTLVGVVLGVIAYLIIPDAASQQVWTAIFALLGVRVIFALTSTPLYILHRDVRQEIITRLTLLGAVLSLIASAALAWSGYPLTSLLVDAALPTVVMGVGAWLAVGWRPARAWDASVARDVWSFATTMWTGSIFSKISFEFDDWLVGKLRGTEALGFYSKAYTLAKMPMDVFAGVIGGIALSVYAQSYAAGRDVFNRVYRLTTWLLMRVVAWSSIVMLAAAEEIVLIMLGPNWQPVPLLVRVMFVYVLGRPLFQNNAQLLIASRHERSYRASQLIQAAALLVLGPPAVYFWGGVGASIAVSVMMLLGFGLSQWHASRQVDAPLIRLYLLPLILTVLITPLLYALGEALGAGIVVSLLVKGALGTLLFGGITYLAERRTAHEVYDLVVDNLLRGGGDDQTA
jgi:teichuronic acid exporter